MGTRAQTPPDEPPAPIAAPVPTETFRDPRPVNIPRPDFPDSERFLLREGWVLVSMMVNAQGSPYEVGVVHSTGNRTFDQLVVEAWRHTRFLPGASNGQPVDSVFEIKYTFSIGPTGLGGARPAFQHAYAALQKALQAGDRAAAEAALQACKVTTLYEDAHYGVAQYQYASTFPDQHRLESGLRRAAAGADYLPGPMRQAVLQANFNLQVQRNDYHEALQMWKRLRAARADQAILAKLAPIVTQIESARTAPGSYTMSGTLEDTGTWSVQLFKRSFAVEAPAGAISLVKLRCQTGFVSFAFDPALMYKVPGRYGQCRLTLEGTPGAALTLTQSS